MEQKTVVVTTPEGPHTLSYTDWGSDSLLPPVLCMHGLTRNARDFDFLAKALSANRRVICLDMIGRGGSDWFTDRQLYQHDTYCQIALQFLNTLEIDVVEWVGTSMGGLTGLFLAATPATTSRIEKLVLNDVGSFIPAAPLKRIGDYVGTDPEFETLQMATQYLRTIAQSFGPLTDDQWQHLAEHSFAQRANQQYGFTYDPNIAWVFEQDIQDTDLTVFWQTIEQPTLLMRGKESDLLLSETANDMAERSNCKLVEFEGVGHAPMLMNEEQISAVIGFLNG